MITFSQLGNYGRLGNQLWQIAATIGTALDYNDTFLFPPWKYESHFNLHGCFANDIKYQVEYQEPFFHYQKIPYKQNLNLKGYFQSPRYFETNKELIKTLLTPNNNIEKQSASSIHVRRTDYFNFPEHHPILTMEYYNAAIEICSSDHYFIFSDDLNWCRENFKGNRFTFIEGNTETIDLALMSKCVNNIIANSSFSFWGAWLNANVDKKVIAPKKWFGSALSMHDTKDLIPPSWIKI